LSTAIEKLIATAAEFIGTKESPKNSNNVIFNTHYYGRTVEGASYPWCAAFVWDIFRLAGMSSAYLDGGKTASCEFVLNFAKKNGAFIEKSALRRGDVVLYRFATNTRAANHIGIVLSATKANVRAIEGNTSASSDDNGGAVMERERDLSFVVGGYRPNYEEGIMDEKEFARLYNQHTSTSATGAQCSPWAAEATDFLREAGIVAGNGEGDFGWRKPVTKEMVAQMIYNLIKYLETERRD